MFILFEKLEHKECMLKKLSSLLPRHMLQMKKLYYNLESFIIHQSMTNQLNSVTYSDLQNEKAAVTLHHH